MGMTQLHVLEKLCVSELHGENCSAYAWVLTC